MSLSPPPNRPRSLGELFWAFTQLGLQGFGSVLPASQRVLCERKRWVSTRQFVALFGVAQVLPGPSACNLALIIGDHFFGWRGALAALGGLIAAPLVLLLALTVVYAHFATVPVVAGAVRGMGLVSAGLIAASGLKLLPSLGGNAMRWPACVLFGAATFVAVALWRLPLVVVLLVAGLLACAFAAWRIGRTDARLKRVPRPQRSAGEPF